MKKIRVTKLVALLLSLLMLSTVVAVPTVSAEARANSAPYSVWDGSIDTSWYDADSTTKTATLVTAAQLAGVAKVRETDNLDDWTIKLGCDMVMNTGSASDWATTAPANVWTPITEFYGTFDGQGYTISGLYYNNTAKKEVGLFAALNGAEVKNVSIVNTYFCGFKQVGSVAGIIKGAASTVSNVYSDAILYAYNNSEANSQVGGIVGANTCSASKINECWFAGEARGVTPNNDNYATEVGGILGYTTATVAISDCMVSGTIEAQSQLGGILGNMNANSCVLTNCLFLGEMIATRANQKVFSGEFVGIAMGSYTFTLKNCYGLDTYAVTYTRSGYDTYKTAEWSSSGSSALTAESNTARFALEELAGDNAKTNLEGFDFDTVWATVDGGVPVIAALQGG